MPLLGISMSSDELARKIEELSDDPSTLLLNAARDNQVLGIGECHVGSPNIRPLIADLMPQFRAAGVTDMFVELGEGAKPALDELNTTGHIVNHHNSLRWLTKDQSYIHLLEAARAAGIRVHAADTDGAAEKRDPTMATTIEDTVKTGTKAIFFVGSSHLKRGDYSYSAGTFSAAANRLRADGISLYSVAENRQICEGGDVPPLNRPLAFRTNRVEAMGAKSFNNGRAGDWDAIITFPTPSEQRVDLGRSGSSDADLRLFFKDYLSGSARRVTHFDLSSTRITDDAVPLLIEQMPNLQEVDLRNTAVTAGGINKLRQARPQLRILWESTPPP